MRYRSDRFEEQADGAKLWFSDWLGGPTLAKIENCRLHMAGEPRRTVTITGEPDTYFSIPAECSYAGVRHMRGYVTRDDDGNAYFRPVYY